MRVRAALAAAIVGCWIAPAAAAAAATETARDAVETMVADVLDVLRMSELAVDGRRTRIQEIVYARFDFETMAKYVLGRKNWTQFEAGQRDAFIAQFKRFLSRSYGTRLSRYEGVEVEVAGEREEKRGDVTVLTIIHGGQFDGASVDYRVRDRDGAWRVIDVVIEGVSLVSNFRSQFKDIVASEGAEGLIHQLKSRNDQASAALAVATQ